MENKPILSHSFASVDKLDSSSISKKKGFLDRIKKRHVLAFYAFFGFFIAYTLRANLSVAIVDMSHTDFHSSPPTIPPPMSEEESANMTTTTAPPISQTQRSEPWSPILQGYILSSFFYGYIITQFPAASLTTKHGGRLFFGGGIGVCSVLCLLTPLAAFLGPSCLIGLRAIQGLAQGFIFPSMHCLWSKWAPPNERSRLATVAFSGSYMGSVVALSFGGLIGQYINWQAIFYVFGTTGLIWTLFWFTFVYESPSQHETIEHEEKLHIENSLSYSDSQAEIPWSIIFKSLPVWAIVFAHFAENWGFYTMLTEMPTFFSDVLKFDLDKAGLWSSLPYLVMANMLYFSGYLSDKLIERKMSYTFVRKLFCVIGFLVQCIFMLSIIFISSANALIVFVTIAIGFGGLPWASFGVNHLDIGARYANVLMSVSNTFASLPGIISPILTGHLTLGKTKSEWDRVFIISAVIYLLGAVVYGIFGTGEIQHWATRSSKEIEIKTHDSSKSDASKEQKPTDIITPPQNSSFSFSESSFSVPVQAPSEQVKH